MKKILCVLIVLSMIFAVCSCGKNVENDRTDDTGAVEEAEISPAEKGDLSAFGGSYAAIPDGASEYASEGGGDQPAPPDDGVEAEPGTLTAGEWKDNDNFDFWTGVLGRDEWQGYAKLWKMDVGKRFAVTVVDGQTPVKNARVLLYDSGNAEIAAAYTDSYGKAYLYYDLAGEGRTPAAYHVTNDYVAEDVAEFTAITDDQLKAGGLTVDVSGWGTFSNIPKYVKLDVMFTVDTTGSMSDELEYLKKELGNVITRVADENTSLDIRLSVNFYRDEGDEYVVRDFAFSGDIDEVLGQLDMQFSDGGGDYPEAVHTALENSISGHDWRSDAVKLLFIVLDAPGHSETDGVPESVRSSVIRAAELGIRIIPVASSGVDKETEFLLRATACATGGTYVFLTDHSGVGEPHLEPTIGDYNVKKLNDLLVKIISEYCR